MALGGGLGARVMVADGQPTARIVQVGRVDPQPGGPPADPEHHGPAGTPGPKSAIVSAVSGASTGGRPRAVSRSAAVHHLRLLASVCGRRGPPTSPPSSRARLRRIRDHRPGAHHAGRSWASSRPASVGLGLSGLARPGVQAGAGHPGRTRLALTWRLLPSAPFAYGAFKYRYRDSARPPPVTAEPSPPEDGAAALKWPESRLARSRSALSLGSASRLASSGHRLPPGFVEPYSWERRGQSWVLSIRTSSSGVPSLGSSSG